MLIDSHTHLNFNAYKDDAEEVIRRSLANNVWMINVGSQYSTSKRAVEIAEKYPQGVYAAIGLHPIHLAGGIFKTKIDPAELSAETHGAGAEEIEFKTKGEQFDFEKYKELAKSPKVVAIGEIGLDYYYRPKTKIKLEQFKERQRQIFLRQMELAKELNLPVIFHCRAAHSELLEILKSEILNLKSGGVIHCFTGSWEQAQEYMDMGLHLGFNGLIFKPAPYRAEGSGSGMNFDEIIRKTPLEKILIETDCPYLTPPPMEGRNEPLYVKYVAEKIAKIKNLSYEEIIKTTTENARDLFRI